MKLAHDFYARPTLQVAEELVGKFLTHRRPDGIVSGRIVEVEAYLGADDLASHARFGPTTRSAIMFGPAGVAYVYLIYGMHHCVNVVCERDGVAGAVLIRALDLPGAEGPGKLCRLLGITREENGVDLTGTRLWIEDRRPLDQTIVRTPRIGVDYAGKWAKKRYRFIVSRPEAKPLRRRRSP